MAAFQDASGLKIFDFSKQTIRQLIAQGPQNATVSLASENKKIVVN